MAKNYSPHRKKRLSLSTRLVAIVSIALPLLVLGWIGIVKLTQQKLDQQVREQVTFSILLNKQSTEEEVAELLQEIRTEPFVKEAVYISPQEAAKELESELGENAENVLGYNPLLSSIEVHLRAEYARPDSLSIVDSKIKSWKGVDSLLYRSDMLRDADRILHNVSIVLLVISGLLLLMAVIQVNNTTHIMIYTRRFLIRTMTLLGAKPFFIRRSFIAYSVFNGLWGGLLSSALTALTIYLLGNWLGIRLISELILTEKLIIYIGLPLVGIILSFFTAFFSTNKYIRMEKGKLILS